VKVVKRGHGKLILCESRHWHYWLASIENRVNC
jgi:hypothetical protein